VVYDSQALLRDVRAMVAQAKAGQAGQAGQAGHGRQ